MQVERKLKVERVGELHHSQGIPIISDWRLVWLKSKPLTPAAKAFLDYIQEKKDAIFARSFSWIQTIHPPDFH